MKQKNRLESDISVVFSNGDRIGYKTITFVLLCYSRDKICYKIFSHLSGKQNFSLIFSQKLLESARKKKILYEVFFFFNGYDIKIQKGNFPAVGINKTLFILFVLFYLFYI